MQTNLARLATLVFCGLALGAPVSASLLIIDIPIHGGTDTLSIDLRPSDGSLAGLPGSTVGWGFHVIWTSDIGDWVSFTGSSLGSVELGESNPSILQGYTDFIGSQGGPVDFALAPGDWSQDFDNLLLLGVGAYTIAPGAVPGAIDFGEITFNFQVFDGDPLLGGTAYAGIADAYYGPSTQFSLTVDVPPLADAPEPSTICLFGFGVLVLALGRIRARETVVSGFDGSLKPRDDVPAGLAPRSAV